MRQCVRPVQGQMPTQRQAVQHYGADLEKVFDARVKGASLSSQAALQVMMAG